MKGYKGFNADMTCRGFQYEVGKVYETDEPIALCKHGFHFCKELSDCFRYYGLYGPNKFAVIEALGNVIEDEDGHKCVTNKIKIVEMLSEHDILKKSNSGEYNTGYGNYGNYNTGYHNDGNFNVGRNNTGSLNTGSYNCGNRNTGYYNSGAYNTGDCNKGNRNTGFCNTGFFNVGNYNTGDLNVGDFNISSGNTGCFMTIEPTIWLFDKPSDTTIEKWHKSKAYDILSGIPITHSSRQAWWDNLEPHEQKIIVSIPNFDPDIFKRCTGVDVTRGRKKGDNNAEESRD